MGAFQSYGIFWRRTLFAMLTMCVIVAIVVQDYTPYLPLGVFSSDVERMAVASLLCLVAAVLVLVVQLIEIASGRLSRLGTTIRGITVFLIVLDILLIFGDRMFVASNPASRLGRYYEVPDSGDPPVILEKNPAGLPVRECLSDADSLLNGPRFLFVGDGYTAGSGGNSPCNYADVAERILRYHWLSTTEVVNAGVAGHGPVETLALLRWYRAQNCPVSALVYNLSLENDLADNLPRTERRVVAGTIARLPSNWFLRTFHPLNTRIFRWALVVSRTRVESKGGAPDAPCDFTVKAPGEIAPSLLATVERDLERARGVSENPHGYDEAMRAIDEMRAIAHEMNVPFIVVVFPDRILADHTMQARLDTPSPPASVKNHGVAVTALRADQVLDVLEILGGREGMYRDDDTRLSDLGNVAAGEFVGSGIAAFLKTDNQAPSSGAMMVR